MEDTITKIHVFKQPIEKVWTAISEGPEISKWFLKADFKPQKGYQYTFTHEGTEIKGEVLAANPVHELIYTWIVGDLSVTTTVSWKLEEVNEGTKVTLIHSGISNYPGDTAVNMFNSFKDGWAGCFAQLEKHLSQS